MLRLRTADMSYNQWSVVTVPPRQDLQDRPIAASLFTSGMLTMLKAVICASWQPVITSQLTVTIIESSVIFQMVSIQIIVLKDGRGSLR